MNHMKWNGKNGHMFELNVRGYQFPEKGASDVHDAEWLKLTVGASNGESSWSNTAPCLLTWELVWLRRWLYNVIDGNFENNEISFVEPELNGTDLSCELRIMSKFDYISTSFMPRFL